MALQITYVQSERREQLNIDFHYGVVYVLARLANVPPAQAQTIAHACQYVDDATTDGTLNFSTGEAFERFATAHVMVDYHTLNRRDDSTVWVPFHFFPGGQGVTLDERAVCRPNSAPVQEMVQAALQAKGRPNGAHRLGIALHTYVDTWAHQNFAGIPSAANAVSHLKDDTAPQQGFVEEVKGLFGHLEATVVDGLFDATRKWSGGALVGHGAALTFPDLPYARWSYVDGHGIPVSRNNLPDFLAAADHAYSMLCAWQAGSVSIDPALVLPAATRSALQTLLSTNRSTDADARLAAIAAALARGDIPGLKESLPAYIGKGIGSWKHLATGIEAADDQYGVASAPPYRALFETSDYRHFHAAVKEARLIITEEILPRHNVRLL